MFGPFHLSLIFNWALKISRQVNFNFYIGLITICTYKAGGPQNWTKNQGLKAVALRALSQCWLCTSATINGPCGAVTCTMLKQCLKDIIEMINSRQERERGGGGIRMGSLWREMNPQNACMHQR